MYSLRTVAGAAEGDGAAPAGIVTTVLGVDVCVLDAGGEITTGWIRTGEAVAVDVFTG